eukprot:2660494-Rhodomonas_salina.1
MITDPVGNPLKRQPGEKSPSSHQLACSELVILALAWPSHHHGRGCLVLSVGASTLLALSASSRRMLVTVTS